MSWDKIVNGDYGQTGELTFVDVDTGNAQDISSYSSSIQMILRDPTGAEATVTASFVTDGTDGKIQYTLANGDIDAAGNWKVRGKVSTGTAVLTSEWLEFNVLR